jgi:hypothetical protein
MLFFHWSYIILFFISTIFYLWVFYGGKSHKFIGLNPITDIHSTPEFYDQEIATELEEEKNKILQDELIFQVGSVPEFENPNGRVNSRGERECRKCLEFWFKVPFPPNRPNFLKNPESGSNLELDCYNKEFNLAVEFNGEQHYRFPHKHITTYEEFAAQARRDIFKKEQCDRNGVHLIVVPYHVKNIPEFIRKRLPIHLRNLAILDPESS